MPLNLPRIIAGIRSSVIMLPGFAKKNDRIIDLWNLYFRTCPMNTGINSDGNFLQITDGCIFFFYPDMKDKFRSILAKKILPVKGLFQSFDPVTNRSDINSMEVYEHNGNLVIGSKIVKQTELDRLMLSPDWP